MRRQTLLLLAGSLAGFLVVGVLQTPVASQAIARLYGTYNGGPIALQANSSGALKVNLSAGSAAPIDATYITQTANGTLTNEQSLGALTTGLVYNTVTAGTGVLSTFTGPLDATLGGTGLASFAVGDLFWANSTTTLERVPGNTAIGIKFLSQGGTGIAALTPTWQSVPALGTFTYWAIDSPSDTGAYYRIISTYSSGTMVGITSTPAGGSTLVKGWITDAAIPNLATIPAGLWRFHADARRAAGGPGRELRYYAEVYKRTTGGVETLLFTTQDSQIITQTSATNPEEVDIEYEHTLVSLNLTDRIVVKWYAKETGSGAGTALSGTWYYAGNTLNRIEFPSQTISADNFIPYTGATAAVNLGTFGLTATGLSTKNGATSAGSVLFYEDSDNGTNAVTLIGPASTADVTIVLPAAAGTVALTADKLSVFAATTSAELAGVLSDESGTGYFALTDSPVFTTQITVPLITTAATNTDLTIDPNGTGKTEIVGQWYQDANTQTSASNAVTCNWQLSNVCRVAFNEATTITLTNPVAGGRYLVWFVAGASAGAVTWADAAAINWPAATGPTITTTSGAASVVALYYDGTTSEYWAMFNLDMR